MTQINNNTNSRKGKHLNYAERCQIAVLKQEGYSMTKIAGIIGCSRQTVKNELDRGTVTQLRRQKQNGKVYDYYYQVYDPDNGQANYDNNRLNCGRSPKWAKDSAFIEWADNMMLKKGFSPDVVVGDAKRQKLFDPAIIPCTTTLYHWIDRGIMKTKNIDLLEKVSRNTSKSKYKARDNKRILGKSIEQRPKEVEDRTTFGHWEIDTVIGSKSKTDSVLLTLVERQTRYEVIIKVKSKTQQAVDEAIEALKKRSGEQFTTLFKTITADNGSEFAGLHEVLHDKLDVYFAHPYSSWERGTSENQHKFIRRFIPKGTPINSISEAQCLRIQHWMNHYPRKILGYQTPYECFLKALRKERRIAA